MGDNRASPTPPEDRTDGAVAEAHWDTPHFWQQVEALFAHYPRRRNALLPVMQLAASQGPVTAQNAPRLASLCEVDPDEALAVARVYRLLTDTSTGDRVAVCTNITCATDGSTALLEALGRILAGQPVVLEEQACFGLCGEGPCVEVNGALYTDMDVPGVLSCLRSTDTGADAASGEDEDELW